MYFKTDYYGIAKAQLKQCCYRFVEKFEILCPCDFILVPVAY